MRLIDAYYGAVPSNWWTIATGGYPHFLAPSFVQGDNAIGKTFSPSRGLGTRRRGSALAKLRSGMTTLALSRARVDKDKACKQWNVDVKLPSWLYVGANAMSLPKNDVMVSIDNETYEMLQQRAKALGVAVDELANRYLVEAAINDAERPDPARRRRVDAIAYYEAEMRRKW